MGKSTNMKTPSSEAPGGVVRVEYIRIDTIERWSRNPKSHDLLAIESSLRRFGFTNPLVRDELSGRLVAGHGRLEACRAMMSRGESPPARVRVDPDGMWALPVLRGVHFTDAREAEAYLIADNQLTMNGAWDSAGLAAILHDIGVDASGLLGTGFTESSVAALLADVEKHTADAAARAPDLGAPEFQPQAMRDDERLDRTNAKPPAVCPHCGKDL